MIQEKLLTPREVADLLQVTIQTLRNWDKLEKLKALRTPGNQRRYRLEQIQNLLK